MLLLPYVALWFILRGDLFYGLPGSLSIAITSLGEERANLSAIRALDRFAHVWSCLFPLPLSV